MLVKLVLCIDTADLSQLQVLRVSYEKNRRYRLQQLGRENMDSGGRIDNEVSSGHRIKPNIHAGSKKRAVTDADLMEVAHVRAYKRQRQLEQASAAEDASASTGGLCLKLFSWSKLSLRYCNQSLTTT